LSSADEKLLRERISEDPVLKEVQQSAEGLRCYLVGGSVRDLLLGRLPSDLDIAVEGPVEELAARLDPDALLHQRFETAEVTVAGRRVDLARTRSEIYSRPGALPEVSAADIRQDLRRRDFTINAIAAPLFENGPLVDPCRGVSDLESGVIEVIHPESFIDDPTRALRAARYATRLGFRVGEQTFRLLSSVDLETVSKERFDSELRLFAREPEVVQALRLASDWGLIALSSEDPGLIESAFGLLEDPEWSRLSNREEVLIAVATGESAPVAGRILPFPGTPSRATSAAARLSPETLILARAAGSEWLDSWIHEWRKVSPLIDGEDLLASGVPRGSAIGIGLDAAQRAALDDGVATREEQLGVALAAIEARAADEAAD
jgi:tRNA nucleotidyltransferase (CCA-adding enzyme)